MMDTEVKSQLQGACRRLMRPIAALLMHCGMTWREFSELSKSVFVDVAARELADGSRSPNVSRVSILSGISRKEVRRQLNLLSAQIEPLPHKTTDATRLLSAWHQDPEFADAAGNPRVLSLNGDVGSFGALLKRYGGDIPPAAMLKALRDARAVAMDADDNLIALKRFYMPTQLDAELIPLAGDVIHELASTLNHNLTRAQQAPSRFQGRATDDRIAADSLDEYRELLERDGQAFLERIDDWLAAHRLPDDAEDSHSIRLGVGIYAIQDSNDRTHSDDK